MASPSHVRGILLEEALLFLLRMSGYRTIEEQDVLPSDPTLTLGHSGIEVIGRGAKHQIDAIADFTIAQPFSHPQRLLVEAKCYEPNRPVGIHIIRNSVGVLKDVSEHWVTVGPNATYSKKRFHYQFALFSASQYTSVAEKYAFAHDIYLIPLTKSPFIQPLIDIIHSVTPAAFGSTTSSININLKNFRQGIREALRAFPGFDARSMDDMRVRQIASNSLAPFLEDYEYRENPRAVEILISFVKEIYQIRGALLGMINNNFPVFLIPNRQVDVRELEAINRVRIYWDDEGWYLYDRERQMRLFSFDIPPELFEQYAEQGLLSRRNALDLKENELSEIQATVVIDGQIRVISFRLDANWLGQVRQNL